MDFNEPLLQERHRRCKEFKRRMNSCYSSIIGFLKYFLTLGFLKNFFTRQQAATDERGAQEEAPEAVHATTKRLWISRFFTRATPPAGTTGEREPDVRGQSRQSMETEQTPVSPKAILRNQIFNRLTQAYNGGNIWDMVSDGFHKKITEDHLKSMKVIFDEKQDLIKESTTTIEMGEKIPDYLTNALTTITVSLYVTVTGFEDSSKFPWWMHVLTFALFVGAGYYLKRYCHMALGYVWNFHGVLVSARHRELVIRMNQLRCLIESLPGNNLVDGAAGIVDGARNISNNARGDMFEYYCYQIVKPINEDRMHVVQRHISYIYMFAILVVCIIGYAVMGNNITEVLTGLWRLFWSWWRNTPAAVPTASPSPSFYLHHT